MRKRPASPRQVFGPFKPTPYGRTLLPALTGLLSAAAALQREMSARGMSIDALPGAEQVEQFLDSSPAGQAVLDVGRIISDIEIRDASGGTVGFETIGFLDMATLSQFGNHPNAATRRSASLQSSHVMVSATLAPRQTPGPTSQRVVIT